MKRLFVILFLLIGVCAYSQVPQPPTLISPPSGIGACPPVVLDWSDVPTATSYRLQISFNPTFSSLALDQTTDSSKYTIPNGIFSGGTNYYWRVNASNQYGPSLWSSIWILSALSLPNPPLLITPPNGAIISPNNYLFDWNNVPGATYFIFHLSKSPLFDSLVVNDTTPLPPIILQYGTQYYWRMKSGNSCGTGNWSSVWTFTTIQAPPPAPVLICDTANVPLTPILDWNDVPTAITYRIQVSNLPNFTSTIINANVPISQYTVPSGILNYSSHYYWRVAAMNIGGQGPYSAICSFNTIIQSGIRNVSSEVPTENKLYSNYPNPFNSTSNLKFEIANLGNVRLVIYDVTGRDVQTLVNEYMKPGTYEATFDGSGLNSGVYFYKLMTGNFTETKKMLIIK
jgi:hypothetical protein